MANVYTLLDRGSSIDQVAEAVNRLVKRDSGLDADSATRVRRTRYDGSDIDRRSRAATTGFYGETYRTSSGNHVAVLLGATAYDAAPSTSNAVLLVQDAAVSVGSGKQLRVYATAGTNFGSLVSDANGGLTLSGTGTAAGTLAFGATPATSGTLRLTNATAVNWRNAGNTADIGISVNASNNVLIGDQTNAATVYLLGATAGVIQVGANLTVQGTTTGAIVSYSGGNLGFFGSAGTTKGTFTQTYSTADATLGGYTASNQSASYTATPAALGTAATLADLNTLRGAYENLRGLTEDLAQFVNAVVDKFQAHGMFA